MAPARRTTNRNRSEREQPCDESRAYSSASSVFRTIGPRNRSTRRRHRAAVTNGPWRHFARKPAGDRRHNADRVVFHAVQEM